MERPVQNKKNVPHKSLYILLVRQIRPQPISPLNRVLLPPYLLISPTAPPFSTDVRQVARCPRMPRSHPHPSAGETRRPPSPAAQTGTHSRLTVSMGRTTMLWADMGTEKQWGE